MSRKKRARLTPKKRLVMSVIAAVLLGCACIPVPVTTLAAAEIVADNPFLVTAPMDGVIASIEVLPNSVVSPGDVLARFEDTALRNEFDLASEDMALSEARLRQAGLSAFVDESTKREITVASAELNLARTRRDYAQNMLGKTVLRAERSGLVLFSDIKDWMGRPVATGEAVMEIADPDHVQIRLEAAIHDGAALTEKARVRLFLDSDPLRPIEGHLTRSSYYAQPQAGGSLAYEAYADFNAGEQTASRIGGRGMAKIYGETAPLGYWLLRRPITAMRQFIGL